MKVIFLDYDGVMNPPNTCLVFHTPRNADFGREAVDNLNYILEKTGAYIVVSATNRGNDSWTVKLFDYNGIDSARYIDYTSSLRDRPRGDEIKQWLTAESIRTGGSEPESFVIIDDESDMGELNDHLVKTNYMIGLTRTDAEKAIKILNGGTETHD